MNIKQKLTAMGLTSAIAISGGLLVSKYEGKENKPYIDPVGILTTCYGATKEVIKDKIYTDDECLKLLADDLKEHDRILMSVVKVPMTDYQHAAFLSFIYNVGPGKAGVKDGFVTLKNGNQSSMLRKLNQKDYHGACNQFLLWMQKGQGLSGIAKRRTDERKMCLGEIKTD